MSGASGFARPRGAIEARRMGPQVDVKYVILFAALREGSLMLAECGDGRLRLLRDEAPIEGACWDNHRIDEAAAEFRRLVAQSQGRKN